LTFVPITSKNSVSGSINTLLSAHLYSLVQSTLAHMCLACGKTSKVLFVTLPYGQFCGTVMIFAIAVLVPTLEKFWFQFRIQTIFSTAFQ
jgi:hypothetical protein